MKNQDDTRHPTDELGDTKHPIDELDDDIHKGASPNDPDGSPNENEITLKRRRFIWRRVTRDGKVSFKELKEITLTRFGAKLTSHAIHADIDFWRKLGFSLSAVASTEGDRREKIIVDTSSYQTTAKPARSMVNADAKQIVAQVAIGTICGFADWSENHLNADQGQPDPNFVIDDEQFVVPKFLENCYTKAQIAAELVRYRTHGVARDNAININNRLNQFYFEQNRLILLDAGTTTTTIATYISRLTLPTPSTRLSTLTVCTNSRAIFQLLGSPDVKCNVIVIGGEQRGRGEAIAGRMSESFLEHSGISKFGVSFLGATAVDLDRMNCCSESQVLSRLKSTMFGQSSLRFVCVDHTKLVSSPMWGAYPFVSITPGQLDMVITDMPLIPINFYELDKEKRKNLLTRWEAFDTAVKKIENHGVPVFIGLPFGESVWPKVRSEDDQIDADSSVKFDRMTRPIKDTVAFDYLQRWREFVYPEERRTEVRASTRQRDT